MKKINCLQGVRAIACICVFLSHFRRAFLPDYHNVLIDNTPLKILTSGNTAVRIFFVLSGFVISYKYMEKKNYDTVPKDIFKRYFRLMPSVLFVNLLAYCFMKQGLLFNVDAAGLSGSEDFLGIYNTFIPDLWICLKEGIATCFVNGANTYVAPLWTMTYEFGGAILVLSVIGISKDKNLRYLFYVIQLTFFSSYYNYFVIGMLICDLYHNTAISEVLTKHKAMNNVLFICSATVVIMQLPDDGVKSSRVLFGMALIGMFLTLICSTWSEKYLGNGSLRYLGKLSYAIYLLHWLIIESLSSWMYIYLTSLGVETKLAIFINISLTGFVVVYCSFLLNKYVELIGQCAVKYIEQGDLA